MEPMLVDLPTTDFSPVIARIVAHDSLPDAVFIYLSKDAAFNLQRQMLDAGIGPQKKTLIVNSASLTDNQAFWQQIPDGKNIRVHQGQDIIEYLATVLRLPESVAALGAARNGS